MSFSNIFAYFFGGLTFANKYLRNISRGSNVEDGKFCNILLGLYFVEKAETYCNIN